MSCTIPSTSGRVKDQRELKHSTHAETRFGPREPFPRQSWARCSISRWRDWLAVGGRWSRRRCSADFSSVDVTEFRVLNFIDRLSYCGAKSCAAALDLTQSIVAAASELASSRSNRSNEFDLALERLGHHAWQ